MATPSFLDELPPVSEIEESAFASVEQISKVRLSPEQRNEIRTYVQRYESHLARETAFRGCAQDRHRVEKAAELARQLSGELKNLLDQNSVLARYLVWPRLYEDVLSGLEDLRNPLSQYLGNVEKGPVSKFFGLGRLLLQLEEVFLKSGGTKSAVSRGTSKHRVSPFATFAWEIVRHLPVIARPASHEALAATWESVDAIRNGSAAEGKAWVHIKRPAKRVRTKKPARVHKGRISRQSFGGDKL